MAAEVALLISPRTEPTPVVELDVPPDFHQVPVAQSVEARTASQLAVLDDLGLADVGQREALSLYLEALAVRLAEGNVVGTAFCAVHLRGRPSTATLTVALQSSHTRDRGLAVMGAAEAMRREGRYDSVEIVQLGQHPAVTAVAHRSSGPGDSASGEVGEPLREMSVLVPVPGFEESAIVTMATPCLEDWAVYVDLVLDVCRSLHVQRSSHQGIG